MHTIGLVDDRKDLRTSTRKAIRYALGKLQKDWNVLDIPPFHDIEDYFPWIRENEICVILVDERLHESKPDSSAPVSYSGHTLVSNLRERYKDLPIIAITSFADDVALQGSSSNFDNIIDRKLFDENSKEYVARFIRFGQKFIDEYAGELKEISDISTRIAQGTTTANDADKLSILQTKLGLIHPDKDLSEKSQWLDIFDDAVQNLEILRDKILKNLDK